MSSGDDDDDVDHLELIPMDITDKNNNDDTTSMWYQTESNVMRDIERLISPFTSNNGTKTFLAAFVVPDEKECKVMRLFKGGHPVHESLVLRMAADGLHVNHGKLDLTWAEHFANVVMSKEGHETYAPSPADNEADQSAIGALVAKMKSICKGRAKSRKVAWFFFYSHEMNPDASFTFKGGGSAWEDFPALTFVRLVLENLNKKLQGPQYVDVATMLIRSEQLTNNEPNALTNVLKSVFDGLNNKDDDANQNALARKVKRGRIASMLPKKGACPEDDDDQVEAMEIDALFAEEEDAQVGDEEPEDGISLTSSSSSMDEEEEDHDVHE